jgi:uncharacterized membrane protein
MAKRFPDIEHSRIDALGDGIYAIALTLLGLDLVGAVMKISQEPDLNSALLHEWPIFFSFVMGFFVLYAVWYQYHVYSQFAGKPHALMVWHHGLGFMVAALVPAGAALLGENINTPNMATAVFYFGLLIFIEGPISLLFLLAMKKRPLTVTSDSPFTGEELHKMGSVYNLIVTVFGVIALTIALFAPWAGLVLYAIFLFTKVNPVGSLNSAQGRLGRLLKISA